MQRNLVTALFRLERSRDPKQVQEVLAALVGWLRVLEQAELRHSLSKLDCAKKLFGWRVWKLLDKNYLCIN
ncbi:MAG TPA: hypothetical protein P5260_16605 [Candidatus Competibacter sp.]|nr:hypothetical protein [Candidatus Competibacter sp.]HRX62815.1 hypothetical protein [Candidatus Competibacter sp.]